MRIITYDFQGNETAKAEVKDFIKNFEDGHYKAVALWTRSRKSKRAKIVRVDIYPIGSKSRIYSIDPKTNTGYVIRRGKVIEKRDILSVHKGTMYERWNNITN